MRIAVICFLGVLMHSPFMAGAELAVTVSPVRSVGQKFIVSLAMKNAFAERIESARAVCFIVNGDGKVVGQASRWIIGTTRNADVAPGATNSFSFVVPAVNPFTSTNLTAKVVFTRVVLEAGKLADPRQVTVTLSEKYTQVGMHV